MVIASLMYANGLKKLLEAILFVAYDHCLAEVQIRDEYICLSRTAEKLASIKCPAIASLVLGAKLVLEKELQANCLREEQNDRRRQECLDMLKRAKVEVSEEWFEKILADHNSRINEGPFKRPWWSKAGYVIGV